MTHDPLDVIDELGPLAQYRDPEAIEGAVAKLEQAQQRLRREYEACATDRERLQCALRVTAALLMTLRKRASGCELSHPDLACENVDVHAIVADWVRFALEAA